MQEEIVTVKDAFGRRRQMYLVERRQNMIYVTDFKGHSELLRGKESRRVVGIRVDAVSVPRGPWNG